MRRKRPRYREYLNKVLLNRPIVVLFILFLLITFFALVTPEHRFVSKQSIRVFLKISPQIALMTLGMGILLIGGEFDLSIGSIHVFSSVILAATCKYFEMSLFVALPLAMLAGTCMGILNGVIVVKTKITSFIVTLGTMWAYRGIMLVLVGGYAIESYLKGAEKKFCNLFTGEVQGIPLQFLWLIIISVVVWVLLQHTRFGNWIYATGSNSQAALMMGINTDRVKVLCFLISGFLCAFAGFLQVSRTSHAIPQSGGIVMLTAIAGAIIGGTSLLGGRGSVAGCVLGAFILQVLSLGLIMLGLIEYYTNITMAIALIATAFAYLRLDAAVRG